MGGEELAKCPCVACGVNLAFPVESAGAEIDCPTCACKTTLYLPGSDSTEAAPTMAEVGDLTDDQIKAAFTGKITPPPVSFFYKAGMIVVLITMLIMPLVYFSLIGLAGWGVYLWATKGVAVLSGGGGDGSCFSR